MKVEKVQFNRKLIPVVLALAWRLRAGIGLRWKLRGFITSAFDHIH